MYLCVAAVGVTVCGETRTGQWSKPDGETTHRGGTGWILSGRCACRRTAQV